MSKVPVGGRVLGPVLRTEHRFAHMARRLSWGVADQGVSSLSNFAVSLVVAHALGAAQFGAFTLAFTAYGVVLNGSRGLSTDPLIVRFSGRRDETWRTAVGAATGAAVMVGVLSGLICVGIGLGLGITHGLGLDFAALGVGLPALTLQDSWRFAFFAVGRGDLSLVVDLAWGLPLIGGLVAILRTGPSVPGCLLAFGATGAVSALVGWALSGVRPRCLQTRRWIRDHSALGGRFLVENLAVGGTRQLQMVAIGAVAGIAAVGVVRAAGIFMGPFVVVLMGIAQVAVPEASQVLRRSPARLGRFCLLIGAAQAAVAAVWGLVMMVLLPHGVGRLLLGSVWKPAYPLVLPMMLGIALSCLCTGAASGLRSMGAARRSMHSQLAVCAVAMVGGYVGALLGDASGAAWGMAVAGGVGAVIWWYQLRRGIAEYVAPPAPQPEDDLVPTIG